MEEKMPNASAGNGDAKVKERHASTKGIDLVITLAIGLVFFLCPIFFTGLVAQGLGFEKMILFYFLVLIGVVAWVTKGVITGELNLKRTPLDLPILAVIATFAVSTILSISGKDSLIGVYGGSAKGLFALIIFALFYYLAVNNISKARIKFFFACLLASTTLLVVYSFLQLRGIHLLPMDFTHNRGFNPIGSLSGLTMYLVMIMPLLVVGAAQLREIFPGAKEGLVLVARVVLGITIIGALAVLAFLNGFTFWPIAVVGAVITLMFLLAKIVKINNNNLLIPLAVFLSLIILLVLGNFSFMNQGLPSEVGLSRSASWDIAKSSIRENPVFGSGPSTFYYSFSKFKSPDFNATPLWNVRFDSSSGAIFEFLSTVGVIGTIAVVVVALIALSLTFLALIKTEDKENNSILLGLFAGMVSAGLYAALFAQNNSIILSTVMISVFALAAAMFMYPEKFKILKLSFRASAKYALALAAIFLCVSAGVVVLFTMGLKMYMADVYARQAVLAGDTGVRIQKLTRATQLAPYQDGYYLTLANDYMALANQAAMNSSDQVAVQNNLTLAIDSGKRAVDLAPNKAGNDESLALIYENASFYTRGALEWAEQLYKKVTELDPQNPSPILRSALINMARSNAETDQSEKEFYIGEAIKKYDEAISKKGDLAAAYYGKAIAYEKLNNLNDAIENLKRANLVSNSNIDYRFELGRLFFNRGVTQPNLAQTASAQIAQNDITPDENPEGEEATTTETAEQLSVQPSQPTGAVTGRNDDLNAAEQIFLSILLANQNHANARYSLAVLYQKIGERENAKIMVNSLLENLSDEATKEAVRIQFRDIL